MHQFEKMQHMLIGQSTVSARARQLNHRLKNRKAAILSRRQHEAALTHAGSESPPTHRNTTNGSGRTPVQSSNGHGQTAQSPPSGFIAVNRHAAHPEGDQRDGENGQSHSSLVHLGIENITVINGQNVRGASPTTRAELMNKFFTTAERDAQNHSQPSDARRASMSASRSRPSLEYGEHSNLFLGTGGASSIIAPTLSAAGHTQTRPSQANKDDGDIYKEDMIQRMEVMQKGDRVLPPCDRCRRLHMDCLRNMTACLGCTKKHAKCSWKDTTEREMKETKSLVPTVAPQIDGSAGATDEKRGPMNGVTSGESRWGPERDVDQPVDREGGNGEAERGTTIANNVGDSERAGENSRRQSVHFSMSAASPKHGPTSFEPFSGRQSGADNATSASAEQSILAGLAEEAQRSVEREGRVQFSEPHPQRPLSQTTPERHSKDQHEIRDHPGHRSYPYVNGVGSSTRDEVRGESISHDALDTVRRAEGTERDPRSHSHSRSQIISTLENAVG